MPSKLEQMQLQFRQRLKEERMIKIHTDNQQKALSKVSKYNGVHGTVQTTTTTATVPKPQPTIVPPQPHHSPIKKGSPGVDRSRPLPPIYKEPRNSSSNRSSPTGGPVENGIKASMIANSRSRSVDLEQKDVVDSRPVQNGTRMVPPRNPFVRPVHVNPQPEPVNWNPQSEPVDRSPTPEPVHVNTPSEPVNINPEPKSVNVYPEPKSVNVNPEPKPTNVNPGSKPVNVNLRSKPMCQSEVLSEKKLDQDAKSRLKQAELRRLKANTKAREESSSRNGFHCTTTRSSPEPRKPARTSNPTMASSRPKPKAQAAAPTTTRRPAATSNKPVNRNAASANSSNANTGSRKPPGPGQEQCAVCGRNFNQDRIEKHRSICKKVATKKVKVFDATKMRVKGTEAEQFVKKGLPKSEPKQAKKADWRKKHNEFIEAIRQAKMVQQHLAKGGKVSDLPPPPPSDTSDYVPCPHCGRKFNEGVAERHIPKCKNILSNKKKQPVPSRRK
ncbi:zinc finger C2HC domain-containing protein 1C [Caerostris darwini]|uniref:Zinc finger C2HC domain-containing protein 1C n=1 Tax=Caerostris darwini TaxID=1538125 RepID=A0AAV4THP3_9ARAC|nr:zinc finger C2HC domain-containing protein 1C [Caerostris darwini]